jgi:hypothetical protein
MIAELLDASMSPRTECQSSMATAALSARP